MKHLLILLTAVCSSSSLAQDRWSSLTSDLTEIQRGAKVPAMGLVIMDARRPAVVSAWGTDVTAATPFRWGSISKTFTALALLRLVEQGRVSLDDPARTYLAANAYHNPWAPAQPLTLLHLLELSGGFGDLSALEFDRNEPLSLTAALELNPAGRTSRWPPGLQHSYSNVNPGLTAAVIERVTGRSFEAFVHAQVLEPLDMGAASFHPVSGLPGGYMADGTTEIPYWHMTFRAFGALNASVRDMSRFLTMLLNDGRLDDRRIFSPATLSGLYRPRSGLGATAGLAVGYGTGAYGWVSHGHVFHGHGGDADGYRSRYGLLPEAGRGYAVVINTDNPALLRRLQRTIEDALTDDLEQLTPTPRVSVPRATLAAYAGDYYPAATRFAFERWQAGALPPAEVRLGGDGLVFIRRGRRVRLIALGSGRFRRPADPVATVVFTSDAAGTLYLQGELGNFVNLNSQPCPGFIPACDS